MKDREIVENAIIPAMLIKMINLLTRDRPDQVEAYQGAKDTLIGELDRLCKRPIVKEEVKLLRRLNRLVDKVYQYYVDNKFDTRKGFIMLTAWAFILDEKDALTFTNPDYVAVLQDLDETVGRGKESIKDFDKIHGSAIKHITRVHELVRAEGYFK